MATTTTALIVVRAAATLTVDFMRTSRFGADEELLVDSERATVASADAETPRVELVAPPFRLSSRREMEPRVTIRDSTGTLENLRRADYSISSSHRDTALLIPGTSLSRCATSAKESDPASSTSIRWPRVICSLAEAPSFASAMRHSNALTRNSGRSSERLRRAERSRGLNLVILPIDK